MTHYLLGYDIRESKRLQRIHRKLMGFAVPIQYSIFLFTGTQKELDACIAKVRPMLEMEDDFRCYELPTRGIVEHLGRNAMPEGIFFSALPENL